MPFKSEAQRRLFHVLAAKGEMSPDTVSEWEHATKNKKKLPMHVADRKRKHYATGKTAAFAKFALNPAQTLAQRAATAVVQGGTSAALNAAMAPEGEKLRQAGIGGLSDAAGGFIGGIPGMVLSPVINTALQHAAAKPPVYLSERLAALKLAYHADDRFKERIKTEFPEGTLDNLRDQATKLTVAPGRYYFPVRGPAGKTDAVAAFKTVGKDNKLVLATILKPKDKPPAGTSLSHLMRQPLSQPLGTTLGKVDAAPKQYTIRRNAEGRLTCSCRDFKFRRAGEGTDCKHIQAFKLKNPDTSSGPKDH